MILITILVVGVLAWWGYKKVKSEAQKERARVEQVQSQAEETARQQAERNNLPAQQNISEEPVPANAPDSASGAPSDIIPPAVSEKAIGYIKKVYTKGGKNYIDIDYVQWLTGDAAEQAMREDGQCPKKGECIVLNDYYIRNQNPLIRTFEVAPEAEILAHDFSADYSAGDWNQSWNFPQFSQYFNQNANNGFWDSVPYHVEIGNNKILKITEQYIP